MRRNHHVSAETAQMLAGVTVTATVLFAAVVSVSGPPALVWSAIVLSGLVAAVAGSLVLASRDRDAARRRVAASRDHGVAIAGQVAPLAAKTRIDIQTLRSLANRISVLDDETAELHAGLDRTEETIDTIQALVTAGSAVEVAPEVVELRRAVRRALHSHPGPWVLEEGVPIHAMASHRLVESALRLVAATLGPERMLTVTVATTDGLARVTIAVHGAELDDPTVSAVFGDGPMLTREIGERPLTLAAARLVARRAGCELSYVWALGRSNFVLSVHPLEAPVVDETPPILTLTLPLEEVDEPRRRAGEHWAS